MKKKWLKRVGNIIVCLCLVFLLRTIYNQDIDFTMYLFNEKYILAYLGIIVMFLVSIGLSTETYKYILKLFGEQDIKDMELRDIYITSNLGKYMPGNVMQFVGRNLLATRYDLKQKDIAASTIIEIIVILGISCILALVFGFNHLVKTATYLYNEYSFIIVILIGILILAGIGFLVLFIKFKSKVLDFIESIDFKQGKTHLIKAVGINIVVQIISSYTYVVIVTVLSPSSTINTLEIMGIYLIAWIAGFVMLGAPGGVGIKEGILVFLLIGMMPKEVVLVSVVIHRCLNIIAEFLAYILMKLIKIVYKKLNKAAV